MRFAKTLLILALLYQAKAARILGIWPIPSKSHYFLGNSLMKGLAEAGHDVTMMSAFKNEDPPSRGTYTDVHLDGIDELHKALLAKAVAKEQSAMSNNHISRSLISQKYITKVLEWELSHPKALALLNSNQTFDVVMFEYFACDALTIFASKFDAHVVLFMSTPASFWVNEKVGNPAPLSYVAQVRGEQSLKMNFMDKLHNTYIYLTDKILKYTLDLPSQERVARKFYPETPPMEEVFTNVSLALINSHESFTQVVPMVPNMVPIGGFHVNPRKPLSTDLRNFLDNASEGVIYFSMGSNINVSSISDHKKDVILGSFSQLRQKILMKWEGDSAEGLPKNVMTRKWLPQNDILGHPNIKLFITHGGMLSTTEAIHHGVPMLTIPVFGDQFLNAKIAEKMGYALMLPLNDPAFTRDKFSAILSELISNPKYTENAKSRSRLFHDRPMKPMDAAVYWIEYVIRHKGAPHLRVLGKDLPWYQYFMLDVILFLVILSYVILKLLFISIKIGVKVFNKKKYKTS